MGLLSNGTHESKLARMMFLVALVASVSVHAFEKLKHGAKLSRAGLGSDLELMVPIENPFSTSGSLRMVEATPDRSDESLTVEPVPPELKSHDSAGQFYLPSAMLQVDRPISPEGREIDILNKLAEERAASNLMQRDSTVIHRNREPVALMDENSLSGASSVDFQGPCGLGYSPFTKVGGTSLDECWSQCRVFSACTQVHFDEEARSCYLSQGISTRPATFVLVSDSAAACRSLTPAGVEALYGTGLPPFRLLSDTQLYLTSKTKVTLQIAFSLAECESACLDSEDCHFGAWVDKAAGASDCYLAESVSNKCALNDCHKVGGDVETILFERNFANMIAQKDATVLDVSSGVKYSDSDSCERKCGADFDAETACLALCLVEARSACQTQCVGSGNCSAVGLMYGNRSDQNCFGFSDLPRLMNRAAVAVEETKRRVDVYVLPGKAPHVPASLMEGRRSRISGMQANYLQFNGACDIFHEGVLLGSGAGISQFTAQSMDECWNLCVSLENGACSQVQFNPASSLCVLGDAIAETYVSGSSGLLCRTLSTTAKALSGMLYTDSVGDQGKKTSNWFSNAAAGVLVSSVQACQAICKMADTQAADSVCQYGGYVACASFFSTSCGGTQGRSHPDCELCRGNTEKGVCRIPQVSGVQSGSLSYTSPNSASPPIACLGGKCVWFEKGATKFSLSSGNSVNFLPQKTSGFLCDSPNYLPSSVKDTSSLGPCYYPVTSLWHCEKLCSLVNQNTGTVGTPACVGGLYTDSNGSKMCRLAKYRLVEGRPCTGVNCAWFELGGEGKTAGLFTTGESLADSGRQQPLPYLMGRGACMQFRAMQAVLTKPPKDFQFSPVEDCTRACMYFPQCSSFQLTGSVSGSTDSSACDVLAGSNSDCTFITCALSTAISLPSPTTANNTLCYTKTPSGLTDQGDAAIDMDDVDPGLPGYTTTNARVRKFSWTDVINQNALILSPSLEECQATCRVSDACISGSWQPCQSIQQYCSSTAGASPELVATCNACSNVNISASQPSLQFPPGLGVCKQASAVNMRTEGCSPEPCYAFEEGGENYFVLSMTKSPFIASDKSLDTSIIAYQGEPGAYTRTQSAGDCENLCSLDADCKYGHFEPFSIGYGNCYLTSAEIRVSDGQTYRLKTPNRCSGTCIVFIKLPTTLPASLTGANSR